MNIRNIKGVYSLAKAPYKAKAIKHGQVWSERICVNAIELFIQSFNSARTIRFSRLPNFRIIGEQQIDNLNSFDYFMQVGKNKYLLEVKHRLFDNNYKLKTSQLKRYRKILDSNIDELKDYIFIFTSLFGNYEVGFIRFSDLGNIDFSKDTYEVPPYKIEFIDIDFVPDEHERDIAQNNFLKSIKYRREF